MTACTGAQTSDGPRPAAGQIGAPLPLQALWLENGEPFDLKALHGKVVLVDFWASWCAPCRQSLPGYAELWRRMRDRGLEVVAVSVDEDEGQAERFVAETPLPFSIVWDAGQKSATRLQLPKMPTAYLLDRTGAVRGIHAGWEDGSMAQIEGELNRLLAELPAGATRSGA